MVVDGVAAAVAAVDVVHLSVVQDVVAVVVVARDYCLHVPHLAELGKEAGIQARRARRLAVVARKYLPAGEALLDLA